MWRWSLSKECRASCWMRHRHHDITRPVIVLVFHPLLMSKLQPHKVNLGVDDLERGLFFVANWGCVYFVRMFLEPEANLVQVASIGAAFGCIVRHLNPFWGDVEMLMSISWIHRICNWRRDMDLSHEGICVGSWEQGITRGKVESSLKWVACELTYELGAKTLVAAARSFSRIQSGFPTSSLPSRGWIGGLN